MKTHQRKALQRNSFEALTLTTLKMSVALVALAVASRADLQAQVAAQRIQEPAQQFTTNIGSGYSSSAVQLINDRAIREQAAAHLAADQASPQPYLVAATAETPSLPDALPDAPSTVMEEGPSSAPTSTFFAPSVQQAPRYDMVIGTGVQAQPLTAGGKVAIALKDTFSLTSLVGITLSAGYSHVTNGQPNYGTNATAFGKRFGAAAARDTSEELFSYAVLAPVLHQDPRYYREGSEHNFVHRTVYAVTRTLVTRTDSGRQTVNASLLGGYAGATALSTVYYPQINRNFRDEASSFGGSLGGEALYFVFTEFFASARDALHLHVAQ